MVLTQLFYSFVFLCVRGLTHDYAHRPIAHGGHSTRLTPTSGPLWLPSRPTRVWYLGVIQVEWFSLLAVC